MFHTYTKQLSGFDDWLVATNRLYFSKHLELGYPLQDYVAIQSHDITTQPCDQFLIFCDDEAGLCGSAAIIALPYDLEIDGQEAPCGTWILRNVIFHIPAGHPLHHRQNKITRLAQRFYPELFEQLWQISQTSNHSVALSMQQDLNAHQDLASLGGFTFAAEMIEEHFDTHIAMGIIQLTDKTYQTFTRKKKKSLSKINLVPSSPVSQVTPPFREVRA